MSGTITFTVTKTYSRESFACPDAEDMELAMELMEDPPEFFDGATWEIVRED